MKQAIHILWRSFLAAGVAEVVLFTFVDPAEFEANRIAIYPIPNGDSHRFPGNKR